MTDPHAIAKGLTKALIQALFWATCNSLSCAFAVTGIYVIIRGKVNPLGLVFVLPILLISVRAILENEHDD